MSGGTAFVQVLGILFSPIITRIYSPEDFGVFTLYNSFLGILLIVGTLKYEFSIPIARNNIIALNIISLSTVLLAIFCLILLFISFFFKEPLLKLLDAEVLMDYIYLLPIGLFFAGFYNILLQWALRTKNFKKIMHTKVSQGIGLNLSQTVLGKLLVGPMGLLVGHIIGKSAGLYTLSKKLYHTEKNSFGSISINKMKWAAKRYVQFPLYTMPSQFLSTVGVELPVFIIIAIYGSTTVGQYGLANLIVNIPVALIGTAIGDVFYAEAAKNGRERPNDLLKLSNKLIKRLLLLGLLPTIILVIGAPFLFSFIFGERWFAAGQFAQIIALLAYTRLVLTPVSRVFLVFEKHLMAFSLNLIRVTIVLFTFGLAYYLEVNPYWAIGYYTIGMSMVYLITYIYAQAIIRKQIKIVENK